MSEQGQPHSIGGRREDAGDTWDARRRQSPGEESLSEAPKPGVWPTLKRTAKEFMDDNLTDWAAALTYYSLLSIFPALLAMVTLIGLFGDPIATTNKLTEIIRELGPESAAETFEGPIRSIASGQNSSAGLLFILGLGAALWSASGYVGAFMRASNVVYETEEGRPFWKLRPLQIAVTLILIVMMALLAVGLVMTGPIVQAVAGPLGIGDTAVTIWNIAKWPVMAVIFMTMVSFLYYASPNVKLRGFHWVTPGGIVAIIVWALASIGFALYVANFGAYNETYGTLGGIIILLIWIWLSNLAILFGHELNAELERGIEIEEGRPGAERQIQLEPREAP